MTEIALIVVVIIVFYLVLMKEKSKSESSLDKWLHIAWMRVLEWEQNKNVMTVMMIIAGEDCIALVMVICNNE